jgi:hypothetical protein
MVGAESQNQLICSNLHWTRHLWRPASLGHQPIVIVMAISAMVFAFYQPSSPLGSLDSGFHCSLYS